MGLTASAVDPWFVNSVLQSNEARYALAGLVGRSPTDLINAETGVLPSGDTTFQPTSNGTSTAPRVSVDRGFCVVNTAAGGTYICTWPTATNVTLTAPASNPRIDTLCARVRDTDVDGSGVKLFELITVDGNPAASPVAPAIPAGYLPLYDIRVGSTAQSGALTITDRRTFTRGAGGVRYCPDWDTARAGSYPLDLRVRSNGAIEVWLGAAWITIASPAVWTQFTPTLYNVNTGAQNLGGAGASAIGRYIVLGKLMHLRYIFRAGSGFAPGNGDIYTQLPSGITSAPSEETQILAKVNAHYPLGTLQAIYQGLAFIPPSSNRMNLYFPISAANSGLTTYRFSNTNGDAGTGAPLVAGGYPLPSILVIQGTIEIT